MLYFGVDIPQREREVLGICQAMLTSDFLHHAMASTRKAFSSSSPAETCVSLVKHQLLSHLLFHLRAPTQPGSLGLRTSQVPVTPSSVTAFGLVKCVRAA